MTDVLCFAFHRLGHTCSAVATTAEPSKVALPTTAELLIVVFGPHTPAETTHHLLEHYRAYHGVHRVEALFLTREEPPASAEPVARAPDGFVYHRLPLDLYSLDATITALAADV